MKTMFLDCFSGISGDMAVGALIDAGADFDAIRDACAALDLPDYELKVEKVNKKGVMATQFRVLDSESGKAHDEVHGHHHADRSGHDHKHDHHHDHHHHHHDHAHSHDHGHDHSHSHEHGHHHHHGVHRHLSDILDIIEKAGLPKAVATASEATFRHIGEAEAEVHGISVEKIHFHEVGLVDSIVDIVAAQAAYHSLGIKQCFSTPLHVGTGTVHCAHGIMPVPAPATTLLLKGIPTYGGEVQGELVTPTGAALAAGWVKDWAAHPAMTIETVGYGSGTKDLPDRANVLRVQIGDSTALLPDLESITVVEATVDDMSGELFAALIEALLAAGARDAFLTPQIGKKGRPAYTATALCDEAKLDAVTRAMFANATTLGLRMRQEKRIVLAREFRQVQTPWGVVRVKLGQYEGAPHAIAPEYEDCRTRAAEAGVAVRAVYEAALAAALKGELEDV